MRTLNFFAVAALCATTAWGAGFQAGYSRADVTPPRGSFMPGYFIYREVKGVLDPCEVACVALSDGERKALVMQIDVTSVCNEYAEMMREAITRATGVPREAIYLHASHTHVSGPLRVVSRRKDCSDETNERILRLAGLYRDQVITRVADVAAEAIEDLKPASLSYGKTFARRISFTRRYLMKDGKVRTNPGVKNPDIVKAVGNPPDEEEQILRIDREGADPICVINFQTHPDVIGGEKVSADWPGITRRVFEAATFGKSRCIVLNGTQGDLNHVNVLPRPGEENGLHRDFDDVDRGYDHAVHMANVLVGGALSVWMKCIPLEAGEIRFAEEKVVVPSQRPSSAAELELAKKYMDLHNTGHDDEIPFKGMELTTALARARRIVRMSKGPKDFNIPLTGIAIGKSVAFCGFSGEPFNDIGKAVKGASPFVLTMPTCNTNGSNGYFPFSDSYKEGGYEAEGSNYAPSVADDLIAGANGLLKKLHE